MGYYTKMCFDDSSDEILAKNHSDKYQMIEGPVT